MSNATVTVDQLPFVQSLTSASRVLAHTPGVGLHTTGQQGLVRLANTDALAALSVTSGAIVDTLCDVNFGDGGGGRWLGVTGGAAAAFADPLNIRGLFVVPNGSDGSACWMRQSGGFFTGHISDDSALVVPVPRRIGQSTGSVYSAHGMLYVVYTLSLSATPNISRGGLFMYDLGSTPTYNQIYLGASCGVATAGTVLTGTTGTDGIITLSFAAETLYVENRTGVSAPVFLNFFVGH